MVSGSFSQEASECHDGSEAGEIKEEEGRDALGVNALGKVGEVEGSLAPEVGHQTAEHPAAPHQAALLAHSGVEEGEVNKGHSIRDSLQ